MGPLDSRWAGTASLPSASLSITIEINMLLMMLPALVVFHFCS